jgi:hypothetical protein
MPRITLGPKGRNVEVAETIATLAIKRGVSSASFTPAYWDGSPPATVEEALNRIAAQLGPINPSGRGT